MKKTFGILITILIISTTTSIVSSQELLLEGEINAEISQVLFGLVEPKINIKNNQTLNINVLEDDGSYLVNSTLRINVSINDITNKQTKWGILPRGFYYIAHIYKVTENPKLMELKNYILPFGKDSIQFGFVPLQEPYLLDNYDIVDNFTIKMNYNIDRLFETEDDGTGSLNTLSSGDIIASENLSINMYTIGVMPFSQGGSALKLYTYNTGFTVLGIYCETIDLTVNYLEY